MPSDNLLTILCWLLVWHMYNYKNTGYILKESELFCVFTSSPFYCFSPFNNNNVLRLCCTMGQNWGQCETAVLLLFSFSVITSCVPLLSTHPDNQAIGHSHSTDSGPPASPYHADHGLCAAALPETGKCSEDWPREKLQHTILAGVPQTHDCWELPGQPAGNLYYIKFIIHINMQLSLKDHNTRRTSSNIPQQFFTFITDWNILDSPHTHTFTCIKHK